MTISFNGSGTNLDYYLEQLLDHKPPKLLSPDVIGLFCHELKKQFIKIPNIIALQSPISIVGDIHGQFHDLLEIFQIGGSPPNTNYLFLGDYVDRGYYSVETISLLLALKLRYPDRVFLIRGNHESRTITTNYGFYSEVLNKYNGCAEVWQSITDLFDYLPLGATIDGKIFATHGGLSPSCQSLDQVRVVDRFKEIPHDGIMADLVWSDPDLEISDFRLSPRGAGYLFGHDILKKFLFENDLVQLLRAHQLCNEGYVSYWNSTCLTVWSAPNYCYRCGNKASILEIEHTNYSNQSGDITRHSTKSSNQDLFSGEYFNVFEASPENNQDTINGKGINGSSSKIDGIWGIELEDCYTSKANNFVTQNDYFL